jgi:hypothetical protein
MQFFNMRLARRVPRCVALAAACGLRGSYARAIVIRGVPGPTSRSSSPGTGSISRPARRHLAAEVAQPFRRFDRARFSCHEANATRESERPKTPGPPLAGAVFGRILERFPLIGPADLFLDTRPAAAVPPPLLFYYPPGARTWHSISCRTTRSGRAAGEISSGWVYDPNVGSVVRRAGASGFFCPEVGS